MALAMLINHKASPWTEFKSVADLPTASLMRAVTIGSIWGYIFMFLEIKT